MLALINYSEKISQTIGSSFSNNHSVTLIVASDLEIYRRLERCHVWKPSSDFYDGRELYNELWVASVGSEADLQLLDSQMRLYESVKYTNLYFQFIPFFVNQYTNLLSENDGFGSVLLSFITSEEGERTYFSRSIYDDFNKSIPFYQISNRFFSIPMRYSVSESGFLKQIKAQIELLKVSELKEQQRIELAKQKEEELISQLAEIERKKARASLELISLSGYQGWFTSSASGSILLKDQTLGNITVQTQVACVDSKQRQQLRYKDRERARVSIKFVSTPENWNYVKSWNTAYLDVAASYIDESGQLVVKRDAVSQRADGYINTFVWLYSDLGKINDFYISAILSDGDEWTSPDLSEAYKIKKALCK